VALFLFNGLFTPLLLVAYDAGPQFLGWLGIVAALVSIPISGMKLAKRDAKVLFGISGLFGILFEIGIGGWLLFASHIIP
jgi:hypothetical protein